jgi:hypothetical protein
LRGFERSVSLVKRDATFRIRILLSLTVLTVGSVRGQNDCTPIGDPVSAHSHAHERISGLNLDVDFGRDGVVSTTQTFTLGVAGEVIHRGPLLNYLTAFQGPGGLILINDLEVVRVLRDGKPEPFRVEKGSGFVSLYIGSSEKELEHGDYHYLVEYRSASDWRQRGREFSGVIDVSGPLPVLPIDDATVRVRLPKGVGFTDLSCSVNGFETGGDDPGYESIFKGGEIIVKTSRALSENRSFFINLTWPSGTFSNQSQWLKVMKQHPRIPLCVFSSILLLWALVTLLVRGRNPKPVAEAVAS